MMSEMKRFKRWRRLQTYFGLLSPAKPALVLLEPLSKTSLWTSSHILLRIDCDCWGQTLQEDTNYAQRQFITFLRHDSAEERKHIFQFLLSRDTGDRLECFNFLIVKVKTKLLASFTSNVLDPLQSVRVPSEDSLEIRKDKLHRSQ